MKTATTFAHILNDGFAPSRPPVGMELKITPYRRCQEITVLYCWKWCYSTWSTLKSVFPKVLQKNIQLLRMMIWKGTIYSRFQSRLFAWKQVETIEWPICQPLLADHWASRRFAWSSYWQSGGWALSSVIQIAPRWCSCWSVHKGLLVAKANMSDV